MMKISALFFGLFVSGMVESAEAGLWMPSIFGDHMVLQKEIELPVWGKATAGDKVVVAVAGQKREAVADANGKWMVKLDPLAMSHEPVEMRVEAGGETRIFKDVLLGDVWLCSGQSNMGMGVGAAVEKDEILINADRPQLRLFEVERNVAFFEIDELPGRWVVSTRESVLGNGRNGFSAVAYLFGSELQQRLKIPVGLIQSAVGGTRIHAWSRLEMLQSLNGLSDTKKRVESFLKERDSLADRQAQYEAEIFPQWQQEYNAWQAKHRAAVEEWKVQAAEAQNRGEPGPTRPKEEQAPRRPLSPNKQFGESTVLFNGMIRPLIPFGIHGVIWYQGEANAYPVLAAEYEKLLAALITDWRTLWGQGDFPFLFVQLPNLEGDKESWAVLRDAQRRVLSLPNTGMAVTIDAGDPVDLHPRRKKPVAERLALAARGVAYREPIVYSGPLFQSMTEKEGKVRLTFTYVGGGLVVGPEASAVTPLQGFQVAGANEEFYSAQAKIEDDNVVLWCDEVPEPRLVRYAWGQNPKPSPNLYNREGLPASPFVSESSFPGK